MVVPVAAKTIRTEYTGQETCYEMLGGREWVSDDGVWHFRDGVHPCTDVTNDNRMTGEMEVIVNLNYKFTDFPVLFCGPMWDKVNLENEGGHWEGTWVGVRTALEGYSIIRVVLRGYGGYEGLQAQASYIRSSPDPTVPYDIVGVIIEPGGK